MFVAVVSKKGGVGKTTTAVNLAAALAERGRRVLLVDLDPQASASRSLGVAREQLAPSVADVLRGSQTALDAVRGTEVKRLDLLTSSADLLDADRERGGKQVPESLSQKLESLRNSYDEVLFDCAPGLSALPTAALVASDAFLVPVTPHFLATEGLRNFLQAVDRLGFRFGKRLQCAGLVLNNVDYRTKVTRQNVSSLREEFGDRVFAVEVRIATKLAEAPAFGQPILEYARFSPASLSFGNLADEYLLRLDGSGMQAALRSVPPADGHQDTEGEAEVEDETPRLGPQRIVRF